MRGTLITIRTAKITCFSIVLIGILGYSPILFTGIFKLQDYEEKPINDRLCYLDMVTASPFLVIWYLVLTFLFTIIIPPIVLIFTNLVLLNSLFVISRNRQIYFHIHSLGPRASANTLIEVKNAKDLLILSIITLVISWPLLTWIYFVGSDRMKLSTNFKYFIIMMKFGNSY